MQSNLIRFRGNQKGASKIGLLVGIAVVVAIVIVLVLIVRPSAKPTTSSAVNSASTSPTNTTLRTVNAPTPMKLYAAANDAFSINFPAAPAVTNSTFVSPTAGNVPVTTYREQDASGTENVYYTVYVYHYPASYTFGSDYLNVALQAYKIALNGNYPGITLLNQQTTSLLGSAALLGQFSVPDHVQGTTFATPDYVTMTVHSHNVYEISGYGMPENDYTTFVHSFRYASYVIY